MTDVTAKKWEAVFADKALTQDLLKMSAEDAVKVLTEKGYDFTVDDVNEAGAALNELAQHVNADGELDEAMLQEIAGGGHISSYFAGVGIGVIAAGVGFAIGLCSW